MRFLGLGLADRVPDARTIWLFREKLTRAEVIQPLFDRFDATLRASGFIAMGGQIVDASLVAAPKQHNTEDEKKELKERRIPEDWKAKPVNLRQKDRDARLSWFAPSHCQPRAGPPNSRGRRSGPTARNRLSISPFRPSDSRTTSRSTGGSV